MTLRLLLLGAILLALPRVASAQRQQCEIVPTASSRATIYPDQGMSFVGGGAHFLCAGGLSIRSDSVAHIEAAGLIEFIGNVRYADSVKTLTAGYTQYIGAQREVISRDDVVLTDIATGSTIRAPYLNYYQASETRPESLVRIFSGRPRAIMIRSASETTPPDTTVIDSDAMDIHGERLFVGRGNVVITRGAMQAFGAEGMFDQEGDSMRISGAARILSDDYRLSGDTIYATMTETQEFRDVVARRQAQLESEDITVDAPGLRILFEDGEVHRLIAVGDGPQARAVSPDFRMTADSIDALAPGSQLERVVAVGAAFGERLTTDSAAAPRPDVAARDWMRGDTIIAAFTAAPEPATDSTKHERLLESITAIAGVELAQSLYALPDENDAGARPALSYLRGKRIEIVLVAGEVTAVRAENAQGLYLQPSDTAAPPPPARTARRNR